MTTTELASPETTRNVAPGRGRGPRLSALADRLGLRSVVQYAAGGFAFYAMLQWIWPTPLGVVLQGLILGALTAFVAFGLSLIYRANRIINFAQADMGAVPAATGICLYTIWGWPYVVAMPAAIVVAIVLGYVVERFLIRAFAKAPRLILMVVTVGLAQILAGAGTVIPILFGIEPIGLFELASPYDSPFGFRFEVSPIVFSGNDVVAMVVVPVVIVALATFLRRTSFGMAVRASAESADRASLLGINVNAVQNVVWVLVTVLATIAMLLRAGIFGLPIGSAFGPAILLRALAAAVIGRMENLALMFAAAAGLGVIEAAIVWNEQGATLLDPTLFVIVIGALLLQRRRRRTRVDDEAISSFQDVAPVRPIPAELVALPEVVWGARLAKAAFGAFLLALPLLLGDADTNLAAAVAVFVVIALSLVILTGWAGEISLGQMAFVAIGAGVGGVITHHHQWDLSLTLLAAGAAGAVASVVIGLPALRIRGLFLAVTTLSFALATSSYLLDRTYFPVLPDNVSQRVTRLPLFGRLDVSSETAFYYVCIAVMAAAIWAVSGLARTRTARVLIASRDNPTNAQAFGVNLTATKLLAFTVSGFLASLAGALFAVHQQAIGQDVFAPAQSIRALTMVVIGGLGSVPGAVLGAVFLKSTEWFSDLVPRQYQFFFTFAGSGAGLLFVLRFLPGGLGQVLYGARDGLLRLVARRRNLLVPSLVADVRVDRAPRHEDGIALDGSLSPLTGVAGGHALDGAAVLAGGIHDGARSGAAPATPSHPPQARPPFSWFPRRPAPLIDYFSYPDLHASGVETSQLSVRAIDVSYGQVQVLFGVTFELEGGEIVALLGTNGAGKSTVLRAISGLTPASRGSVSFEGADITFYPPHRTAADGLIQVPGGRGVFPSLTVAENIALGGWMFRRDAVYLREATERVLDLFPILRQKRQQPAASLSGGQRQMLTLAMALMAKPKVLMIDELSLGLAPVVVEQLLEVVRKLNHEGVTVILVEQSVNVALTVAHTAFFMEKGEIRFHGPTAELLERPDILRSVFLEGASARDEVVGNGATVKARPRARRTQTAGERPVRLEATGVSKAFAGVTAVSDVSFRLHEGEILGFVGPNGAGKTTLFDLLSGFQPLDRGHIEIDGRDISNLAADRRARLGLARSFQDARLFGALTVADTIAVALDLKHDAHDAVAAVLRLPDVMAAESAVRDRVDELVGLMGLGAFRDKFISELSTGSRRIVDLACQIALDPRVVLFDEPSSGIAQREAEALGPLLRRIRDETGASLLVIEHDMPLLTSVADRMIALDLGRIVCEGDPGVVLNDPTVVASYLGTTREVIERSGTRDAGDLAKESVGSPA